MQKSNGEKLKVFISSTSKDLKDYRAVARFVVMDMRWYPDMHEHWDAKPEPTVEACYDELNECDMLVLILAFRRGWVPTIEQGGDGQNSITALELAHARKNHIPVLAFLGEENWPQNQCESDESARSWIKKFRKELNLPATFFNYEKPTGDESEMLPDFRNKLKSALLSHREKLLKEQEPAVSPSGLDNFDGASMRLLSGRCIPFLGHGIYGKGPLSICGLRKALGDESCEACQGSIESCQRSCLATAAEYKSRSQGRDLFLDCLRNIVEEQTRQAAEAVPVVYDLLLKFKPPIIVSATEDLLLEEQLAAAGKRCLILCHVIRSENRLEEGKVLFFEGPADDNPSPLAADEIVLTAEEEDYIIYKPLGSPLLNRVTKNGLNFDTVVMTEVDYLDFLRRLGNEKTGVPTAFSVFFRKNPPIFLGYPMDVWHYRLVGQVFQSIGLTGSQSTPLFAVRKPTSRMEELAWDGLNVKLVLMDPCEFARKTEDNP